MTKERLSFRDRQKIENLYKNNVKKIDIARQIGCSRPTIYREINRGWDPVRETYSAELGQKAIFGGL